VDPLPQHIERQIQYDDLRARTEFVGPLPEQVPLSHGPASVVQDHADIQRQRPRR